MKNKSRLANLLLTVGTEEMADSYRYADYMLESFDSRELMHSVFEMLILDDKIDDAQRAQLKDVYCRIFPENAERFTHDPSEKPKWWERPKEQPEPS